MALKLQKNPVNSYDTLSFARPNKDRLYIKILQIIAKNPYITKLEVMRTLGKKLEIGYDSKVWRSLTGHNMVEKYREANFTYYDITENGKNLLKKVGVI